MYAHCGQMEGVLVLIPLACAVAAYLLTDASLVMSFLNKNNQCDIQECQVPVRSSFVPPHRCLAQRCKLTYLLLHVVVYSSKVRAIPGACGAVQKSRLPQERPRAAG